MTLKLRVRNKLEEIKKGNEQASDCFFYRGKTGRTQFYSCTFMLSKMKMLGKSIHERHVLCCLVFVFTCAWYSVQ